MEPPKDAVVTLACQLPIGNVVTLWYHVSHHDILYWHKGTSRANRKYCNDIRVTVEPPRYVVGVTPYISYNGYEDPSKAVKDVKDVHRLSNLESLVRSFVSSVLGMRL